MEKIKKNQSGADDSDVNSLDGIIKALYESLFFEPGKKSNWERLKKFFIQNWRLITPELPDSPSKVLSVDEYIFIRNLQIIFRYMKI